MNATCLLIKALTVGPIAIRQSVGDPSVPALYGAMESYLGTHYADVDLAWLRLRFGNSEQQAALTQALVSSGAADDAHMVALAAMLLQSIPSDGAGQSLEPAAIDLADVEAANIRIRDVAAPGAGVRLKTTRIAGDLEITDVTTGTRVATAVPRTPAPTRDGQRTIGILLLAANPVDMQPLQLDEEVRASDLALRQAAFRDSFRLEQHWAVRVEDIPELLLRTQPQIVHFCGHGSQFSELVFKDDATGHGRAADPEMLANLFTILKQDIRCVVLNGCYSQVQAEAIARSIDAVVGVAQAIEDTAAAEFAGGFYLGLASGLSIAAAFDLAQTRVAMRHPDDAKFLQLYGRSSAERQFMVGKQTS